LKKFVNFAVKTTAPVRVEVVDCLLLKKGRSCEGNTGLQILAHQEYHGFMIQRYD
jgi:hypothetical protein